MSGNGWDELAVTDPRRTAARRTIYDQCQRRGWTDADVIALTDVGQYHDPPDIIDAFALWAERNPGVVPKAHNLKILLEPDQTTDAMRDARRALRRGSE